MIKKDGTVTIGSHFINITDFSEKMRYVINLYIRQNLVGKQLVKENGRWITKAGKAFIQVSPDKKEITFHIGLKDKLFTFMHNLGIKHDNLDFTTLEFRDYIPAKSGYQTRKDYSLRDYQEPIHTYVLAPGERKIVNLATGYGKGYLKTTRVKVPNGWAVLGKLKVGDVVSTPSGGTDIIEGIFDNDNMPMYLVTFADGRQISCDSEHLWEIYSYEFGNKRGDWYVKNTEELYHRFQELEEQGAVNRTWIPLVNPNKSPDKDVDLPADPYLMGTIIGSNDSMAEAVGVPEMYMNASHAQRLELIRGLMDTNGTAAESPEFTTAVERLSIQMQQLLFSVGCTCERTSEHTHYTGKKIKPVVRKSWRLYICAPCPSDLFKLPSNKQVCGDGGDLKLHIAKIEKLDMTADTRCIKLTGKEKLYIVDDYIVSHNTFVAMKCAETIGERFAVVVLPKYKDKWINDICDNSSNVKKCTKKDKVCHYVVLDSCSKLQEYIADCQEQPGFDDDEVWCLIITITTLMKYIELYYESIDDNGETDWVHPADIWNVMRVGLRITDEVHEHFHRNYVIDLHTHCPKTLYLSATLEPTNKFDIRMYNDMFPPELRKGGDLYTPYIDAYSIHYRHINGENIRCTRQGSYSHVIYESNFLKKTPHAQKCLKEYFDMIYRSITVHYLEQRKPNQKAIIFFSTVEMCSKFVGYLRGKLPDLDIRRYVAEDDYADVMDADISVSTPGSAGTALDIYGLIYVCMTMSMQSRQSNLQIMGRARELKNWKGQYPRFAWLVADDIQKSVNYHYDKLKLLSGRIRSHNEQNFGTVIPK